MTSINLLNKYNVNQQGNRKLKVNFNLKTRILEIKQKVLIKKKEKASKTQTFFKLIRFTNVRI